MLEVLQKLSREYFEQGITLEEYRGSARNYRKFVQDLIDEVQLPQSLVQEFVAAKEKFDEGIMATVNTEDWCGDWACNAAILGKLFDSADVEFRIFRGSEFPEIKEHYEQEGDDHIPAVSIWDKDGNELIRWIEAPALVTQKKSEWKAEHPEFEKTYENSSSDPAAAKAWPKMYRDFLEEMSGWYKGGMWNETVREITARLNLASEAAQLPVKA